MSGWMLKATLLAIGSSCSVRPAQAQSRMIAEGARATAAVIHITTPTPRVHLATMAYSGATANVSLYTTSNVVVGSGDALVLYATGQIRIGGAAIPSTTPVPGSLLTATQTWSGENRWLGFSSMSAVGFASSNTAAGGLYGYYRGTQTWISAMTNIANNCCACATNSTTTFVSDSGTMTITTSGSVNSEQAGGEIIGWSILVDGLNPPGNGLTCGGPIAQAGQQLLGSALGVGTVNLNIATSRRVTVAPGSHQFCLTLCSNSATGDTIAYAQPILVIEEAH